MPSKFPPQKTPTASYEKRLEWCRRSFSKRPFVVSDFEAKADTTQFGIDIFYHFANQHPQAEFSWILGEDQLAQLSYWKEIDRYCGRIQWLVVPRESLKLHQGLLSHRLLKGSVGYEWLNVQALWPASSTDLRHHLTARDRAKSSRTLTWLPKGIKDDVIKTYSSMTTERQKEYRH